MNTTVIFSMYAHAVKRALALLKSLPDTSNEPEFVSRPPFKICLELGTIVKDNLNPDHWISISTVGPLFEDQCLTSSFQLCLQPAI